MTPDRSRILPCEEEKRIRTLLAAAAESDGLRAPGRVESALVAELRRRNRRSLAGRIVAAGALAAAALIGLFLARSATEPPPLPAAPASALRPAPATVAKTPAPPPAKRSIPKRAKPQAAPVESAEFIPAGVWQAFEPMERGSIVRVRLPKSSLPGFGIPVSADRWNESIPADAVLGEDGSMRAIRFASTVR